MNGFLTLLSRSLLLLLFSYVLSSGCASFRPGNKAPLPVAESLTGTARDLDGLRVFFVTTNLKDKIFGDDFSGSFLTLTAHLKAWRSIYGNALIPIHAGELHDNSDPIEKPIRDTVKKLLSDLNFYIMPAKPEHVIQSVPVRYLSDPHQVCELRSPGQPPEFNVFLPPRRSTKNTPQGLCVASLLESPYRELDSIYGFTVISGGNTFIAHWGGNSPYVEAGARSHGYVLVVVDANGRALEMIGPVFTPAKPDDLSRLQEYALFGKSLSRDSETEEALKQVARDHEDLFKNPVGVLPDGPTRARDAALQAVHESLQADVTLIPSGAFGRLPKKETLMGRDLYNLIPEDDRVELISITGSHLRTLLEIATSGSRVRPLIAGVSLDLVETGKRSRKSRDLNRNRRLDAFERNRISAIRMDSTGLPLKDTSYYEVALPQEVLKGCDDYGVWAKQKETVLARQNSTKSLPSIRNTFRKWLKRVID